MIEFNKTLKSYFKQLKIICIIYIFIGIFLSWIILKSTTEFSLIYLPLMIFSLVIGYIAVVHINPGGNVNYYFTKHKRTKDEEALNNLIIKYRSKTLVTLVWIILLIANIYYMIYSHRLDVIFNLDLIIWTLIFPGVSFLCLGIGVKYISAWFNIEKNTKIKNGIKYIQLRDDK